MKTEMPCAVAFYSLLHRAFFRLSYFVGGENPVDLAKSITLK
jgi:hypothetical protein